MSISPLYQAIEECIYLLSSVNFNNFFKYLNFENVWVGVYVSMKVFICSHRIILILKSQTMMFLVIFDVRFSSYYHIAIIIHSSFNIIKLYNVTIRFLFVFSRFFSPRNGKLKKQTAIWYEYDALGMHIWNYKKYNYFIHLDKVDHTWEIHSKTIRLNIIVQLYWYLNNNCIKRSF